MQLPSIENLRCFDAAVRAPSFRAAARAVSLTPAAFGQRIRQLEEQIGAQLFQRTTRSVTLTEPGLALVPRAREVLEAAGRCAQVAKSGELPPMELTLGTRYELGLSFLLPLHDVVKAAHPNLTLHYYYGAGSDLMLRVRSREIDCAVSSARMTDPLLESIRLHREDYAFVGSPELLDSTPFTREAHAEGHTLIDISGELPLFRYWRDAPEGGDRLRFKRIWRVSSIEPIRRLVLAGRGVAVLPQYHIQDDLTAGHLRKIFPSIHPLFDYFRLVFRADDTRQSVYASLAETLKQHPLK